MSATTRARSIAVGTGLAGLVTALTPIWFVHDRATRLRSRGRTASTTPIRRVGASDVTVQSVLAGAEPVIVEGLTDALGIGDAATPASLRRRAGDATFTATFHHAAAPYFLYSGGYGAEVSEKRTITVDELLDLLFGADTDVPEGPPDGTVLYQLFGTRSLDGRVAAELDEFDRAIAPVAGEPTAPQFSGVWIGSAGVVTPLHHDAWPGLLFQTHGRKRVAMYAPRDRTNLYFRPPLVGAGRWSDLPGRSGDADPGQYPRLARTERLTGELAPGDALYIPPFWAHEMEAIEANISVPFRFATRRRSYLDPGFLRPASELARARFQR